MTIPSDSEDDSFSLEFHQSTDYSQDIALQVLINYKWLLEYFQLVYYWINSAVEAPCTYLKKMIWNIIVLNI